MAAVHAGRPTLPTSDMMAGRDAAEIVKGTVLYNFVVVLFTVQTDLSIDFQGGSE